MRRYFEELVDRMQSAVLVPHLIDPNASFNNCHENADRWVSANPGYEIARGWLVFSTSGGYMFHAHSVVRGPAGLEDVTPLQVSGFHFLPHAGTEAEFWAIAENNAQHIHFS